MMHANHDMQFAAVGSAGDDAFGDTEAFERSERLLQNIQDYTAMTFALLWQRQAILFSAAVLTAFYFDVMNAVVFYAVIVLCEAQDYVIARRVRELTPHDRRAILLSLAWILMNTVLSASAIAAYAISVSLSQKTTGDFTPLFFLFAASLFAAMNNHQILWALIMRLAIYGISFLVIVVSDLWLQRPDLASELWLQFFTVVFVMYFLIDCSRVFLNLYRRNLQQMADLRREHERTKAAYLAKSQFVSTVSHELRTPLTSIKGSLDLINSGAIGPVPEQMRGLIEMASKNGARLSTLINDVLDLQKIEAGEMKFKQQMVDVPALLAESVATTQGLAESNAVTIEADTAPVVPLHVMADESRLTQVVANMISNAAKFSHAGGRVLVGCRSVGEHVRIYVQDEGIGLSEDAKEQVFDRFTQIDSSDERHAGGTGLGMNISKEIVERFGGTIDYVSQLGEGTTFFVDLPAVEAETAEAA